MYLMPLQQVRYGLGENQVSGSVFSLFWCFRLVPTPLQTVLLLPLHFTYLDENHDILPAAIEHQTPEERCVSPQNLSLGLRLLFQGAHCGDVPPTTQILLVVIVSKVVVVVAAVLIEVVCQWWWWWWCWVSKVVVCKRQEACKKDRQGGGRLHRYRKGRRERRRGGGGKEREGREGEIERKQHRRVVVVADRERDGRGPRYPSNVVFSKNIVVVYGKRTI